MSLNIIAYFLFTHYFVIVKKFLIDLTSKHRTKKANMQLGVLLAFVAGAVNAAGFLAVGYYTSHMTGIASSVGDYIALNNIRAALISCGFLFSFILGAITTALIVNHARAKKLDSEFALVLLLEAMLLLVFGYGITEQYSHIISGVGIVCLLCFIMGLQNAIITKISNAEIRTTHVTGLVTDIGIELGRYIYYFFSGNKDITLHPDKLRLHSALFLSFVIGGVAGAFGFRYFGHLAALPFSLLLALPSFMPLLKDIKRPPRSLSQPRNQG